MYFITCFNQTENDFSDDIKTFGFFKDIKTCRKALNENWCDKHECCYTFAVIERIEPGIHPKSEKIAWFKWDKNKSGFFEVDNPIGAGNLSNYAIAIG